MAACLLWMVVPAAPGDEIVHGQARLERVRIVDVDGANIAYRTPSGAFRLLPFSEITSLRIDTVGTLGDLNEAERRLATEDYVRAIMHYERAVRLASDFWKPLVRARFIRAADRADRIDTVAKQFVALLADRQRGPALAAEVMPIFAPTAGSRGVQRAVRTLNTAIEHAQSQSERVLLELLKFRVVSVRDGAGGLQAALDVAQSPIPPAVASRPVYRVRASVLRALLEVGRVDEVLAEADRAIESAPMRVLPEMLLVKAQALFVAAGDERGFARSGWAAMRLAIHFPDDDLVPEALLLAAQVHERMDRVPTALSLLAECMQHSAVTATVRDRASSYMRRLQAPG